jgi:hypothetical protein
MLFVLELKSVACLSTIIFQAWEEILLSAVASNKVLELSD